MLMRDLSDVAGLDQVDIIIGLVALHYSRQVLQACWKGCLVKGECPFPPLAVLCIASAVTPGWWPWYMTGQPQTTCSAMPGWS